MPDVSPTYPVPVCRTVADLRSLVDGWKHQGLRVGLVPTMGALHHGHLSLVEEIAARVDKVIVSIFVNPTQFGVHEDLRKYPRQERQDLEALAATSAALVFAPTSDEMYPDGFETSVSVPRLGRDFEGTHRPGHFDGVATVVLKLILQSRCDTAIFGEKDYQQLAVIRRLVKDLDVSCEILGGTLVREVDGLAASSRNVYLTGAQRQIAGKFNLILRDLVKGAEAGGDLRTLEKEASNTLIEAGFDAVDYVSIVDAQTLDIIDTVSREARVLAVARLGKTRLLDNMAIKAG